MAFLLPLEVGFRWIRRKPWLGDFLDKDREMCNEHSKISLKACFAIPSAKMVPGMNPIAKKKGLEAAELKYDLTFRVGRG